MSCPKKFHVFNGGFTCNGQKYEEFENRTHCEYNEMCKEAYESYKLETEGEPMNSIKHPFRFWWWLKSLFRRRRFSADAIEPAEKLINDRFSMIQDNNTLSSSPFIIVPSPRIDYCGACKAEHGYDCPLDKAE